MTSTAVIAHELRAFGFLFCFEFQVPGWFKLFGYSFIETCNLFCSRTRLDTWPQKYTLTHTIRRLWTLYG